MTTPWIAPMKNNDLSRRPARRPRILVPSFCYGALLGVVIDICKADAGSEPPLFRDDEMSIGIAMEDDRRRGTDGGGEPAPE